jgi:hypothetical protein
MTSIRRALPFGPGGVDHLSYKHPHGDIPSDASYLACRPIAEACRGLKTVAIDVKRAGDLPDPSAMAKMPSSLEELTLDYPWSHFPPISFAKQLSDCVWGPDSAVSPSLTIGCATSTAALNRGEEVKAINDALRRIELTRKEEHEDKRLRGRCQDISSSGVTA